MTEKEKRAWEFLNRRGIKTKKQAKDVFKKTEDVDFGFFTTKFDIEQLKKEREKLFS